MFKSLAEISIRVRYIFILCALLSLGVIQVVFLLISQGISSENQRLIQSFLNDRKAATNPYLVVMRIEDLERQEKLACTKFRRSDDKENFIDLSFKVRCADDSWIDKVVLLKYNPMSVVVSGNDGVRWFLETRSLSSVYMRLGLWVSRALVFVMVGLGFLFYLKIFSLWKRQRTLELEHTEQILNLSSQVAHDIRSPLSALSMVASSLKELPENKRLIIRNATQRINDIANQLLQKHKTLVNVKEESELNNSAIEPVLLFGVLDYIVSEKRVQFRERIEVDIQGDLNDGHGLFVSISTTEFSRAISNLVNNSVEACPGSGRVTISLRVNNEQVQVLIVDNGKGIPENILSRLGERGITYGKDGSQNSGSGLGVYHARQTAESAGGAFTIQSQLGVGTTVSFSLPRAKTPEWFIDKIRIPFGTNVVSVDDDQTIHQIWAGRFSASGSETSRIKHLTFSSCEQFEYWFLANHELPALYLVDYEFIGQAMNGLDVIERTGIATKAVLVTSRYEESHIRRRANSLGVRILPKSLAPFILIDLESETKKCHAILIDDDDLVHMSWKFAAQEKNKSFSGFYNQLDFLESAKQFDLSSNIYVDSNLGNGIRGEEFAKKISEMGFENIYLCTGYQSTEFAPMPWIKAILGKEPCF